MEQKEQAGPQQQAQYPQPGGSPFMMMFLLLFMMFFLLDPNMRNGAGNIAGGILYPLYGFNDQYPHLTLFCSGVTMVLITTTIRHVFMDWLKMAEIQAKFKGFNKKMGELRRAGNFEKVQKLSEKHRPELMQMHAEMQGFQMKPMVFTMIVAIPIFMWLHQFIGDVPDGARAVSLPWEPKWWLDNRFILPYWVALYSLLTIPIGQTYQRLLKLVSFRERLSQEEGTRHIRANQRFDVCTLALEKLGEAMIYYKDGKKRLKKAEEQIAEKRYLEALELCDEVAAGIETVKKEHFEAQTEIDVVREMMKREEHLEIAGAKKHFEEAQKDFERGEYSSALFYAKKAKRIIRELTEMQSEKDKLLKDIRSELDKVTGEFQEIDVSRAEELVAEAEKSKNRELVSENVEQARREIKKAKQYFLDASELKEKLEKSLKTVKEMNIPTSDETELLKELEYHFRKKDFHTFLTKGEEFLATLGAKIEKKEGVLSDISHAELLMKNAMSFGADVEKASKLLEEAKEAQRMGDDATAEELIKTTIEEAEKAKDAAKKYSE